jgi:hypothetical protein
VLATQGRGAWPVCGHGLGSASLREAPARPKADQSGPVAIADVENNAVSGEDAPAMKPNSAHAVQAAAFSPIAQNLQVGGANDLRAPAPQGADSDAPDAPAADDTDPMSDAEPAQDETPADDSTSPAEGTEAAADVSTDALGDFVLAAKAQGLNVTV